MLYSNETKNNLMKMTGLSKMQLENWFTNNRKVKKLIKHLK